MEESFVNQYDPHQHHRRSLRLKGWDYRAPGVYFVTICSHRRELLFENADFADIAANALLRIPQQAHAQHVVLDAWVVMPNHIHVIFIFVDYPAQTDMTAELGQFENALVGSLGVVVGRYKTAVSTRINNLRHSWGTAVWQRGYYERIIRNEREMQATQQYIINNPARWAEDHDNLDAPLAKMNYHR
jgi:REP element-mobilizing transposase RayT